MTVLSKEKAVAETTAQSDTKRKYHRNILADSIERVKKRFDQTATSFWRVNYNLEAARKEHADLGHLWKQVWYCIVLSVFRLISGVVR